jgi:hypothetical protein
MLQQLGEKAKDAEISQSDLPQAQRLILGVNTEKAISVEVRE